MKGKINVRYIDFTSARNGNRIFNFSITTEDQIETPTSVEIPQDLLTGVNRIPLQDGVGICYEKLRSLIGIGPIKVPRRVSLTESDVAEFRTNSGVPPRRKHAFVKRTHSS